MTTFDAPNRKKKIVFTSPRMFSILWNQILIFGETFSFQSAKALNLDKSKFLSLGEGLNEQQKTPMLSPKFNRAKLLWLWCVDRGIPPIIKSWPQSFRRSLKFYSKCKRLMTWRIHPGNWMLTSTINFRERLKDYWKWFNDGLITKSFIIIQYWEYRLITKKKKERGKRTSELYLTTCRAENILGHWLCAPLYWSGSNTFWINIGLS